MHICNMYCMYVSDGIMIQRLMFYICSLYVQMCFRSMNSDNHPMYIYFLYRIYHTNTHINVGRRLYNTPIPEYIKPVYSVYNLFHSTLHKSKNCAILIDLPAHTFKFRQGSGWVSQR